MTHDQSGAHDSAGEAPFAFSFELAAAAPTFIDDLSPTYRTLRRHDPVHGYR